MLAVGRRPTIRDVAARAAVHPATASRALNPALPGRVADTTARRVREAARELGYLPDPTARSLRTRRSGFVGVVVPDLTNPVLPPIVRGIEEALWRAGLACLLADTDNSPEREAAVVDALLARRCEGLIVATATRDSPTVLALGGDVPAVLVTRAVDGVALPLVAADDASGVHAAVRHLADLGHTGLAHVTGPESLSTTTIREAAFRAALADALPSASPPIVRHGPRFTIDVGRDLMRELLEHQADVTAVVAGNDMLAIGCLEALAGAGLRCPADLSVTGHNDMPLVDRLHPPLTTVAFDQHMLGVRAAEVLLAQLRGEAVDSTPLLLPTKLVVRGSTGRCPPCA